ALARELRVQDDLEEEVAQLLADLPGVPRVERLDDLVGLLEHVGPQRRSGLGAVPGAAALAAQARDDLDQAGDGVRRGGLYRCSVESHPTTFPSGSKVTERFSSRAM